MPFPWEKSAPVLETRLNLQPGNARIPRGQSLRIRVEITGKSTDEVRLWLYPDEPTFYRGRR